MNGRTGYDLHRSIDDIERNMKKIDLDNKLRDTNSNSEHGHSSFSQNNYFYEIPHHSNNLFHINFVRSMCIRSQDERFCHLKMSILNHYHISSVQ